MTNIVITNSVTWFGENAFGFCSGLASVTCLSTTPPQIGSDAFSYINISTIALYVPAESVELYKADEGWKKFDIRAIESIEPCVLDSGTCVANGDNLTWKLSCDGVLTISGIGDMESFDDVHVPWEKYRDSIQSVIIEDGVTNVSDYAFYNCSNIINVSIGNSVTTIGFEAFYNCSSLTSVTIPNSVTSLGSSAFDQCSSLTNVSISNNLTSIAFAAFAFCSSLEHVDIPYGVKSIEENAFFFCSNLTNVNISNSVVNIGINAFSNCSNLTKILIPNSVSNIGIGAFEFCNSLSEIVVDKNNKTLDSRNNCNAIIETASNTLIVGCKNTTIPNDIKSIGISAFYACRSLTSITIPNSVTSINKEAFLFCSHLMELTIGDSVTSIGDNAFAECDSLQKVTCFATTPPQIASGAFNDVNTSTIPLYVPAESVELYKAAEGWKEFDIRAIESIEPCVLDSGTCGANGDNLTWQLSCDGVLTISGIGEMDGYYSSNHSPWYNYRDSITKVIINDSVTNIGDSAFAGCSSLTSIVIPNSVTSIGSYAFSGCSSLTSIEIPNSVTSIGYATFSDCRSLTSIVIPDSVTDIRNSAFYGCSSLTSIEIPNSVTSIESSAFFECSSLTSINIGNSVTSIGYMAFSNCSSLTSIEIPNSVKCIGIDAFAGCSNLINVTLGNSVDTIDGMAFWGCNIKNLIIPKSVRYIAEDAFWENYSLSTIIVEDGNPKYDSRDNCNAIIKTSTNTLIVGCQNTIIPNSVTSIGGQGAFHGCSLTSIEIPNSVTSIGEYAFCECDSLQKIICLATTPPQISSDAFVGVETSTIPLYVPAKSVELYKAAAVWKEFDILAIGDSASFTVNFVGFNGADLGSQQVAKGDSAIAPDPQTPNGYTFIGWDKDFYNVQSDMTITAIYNQNTSNETINITNDVYVSIFQNNEAEYSEKNINLAAGSAFTVDTLVNLEVGTITQNINLSSAASIFACAENLSADTLKIQFDIKTGIWYYLCFPFDIPFNNISSPGQYVIYEYDGVTRAQKGSGGWQRTTSGKFTAMKGYIFQASENGTLIITIENPQFPCSAETILPVYASQYQQHANWSLIGNPYPSYYNMGALRVFSKFNAPVYVRCKDKDDYDVYIPADDEYHFRPYEAFFVQNPNNAQSTIYWDILGCETASQIGIKPNNIIRRERQAEQNRYFVEITIVGNNSDDHTRVVFNDEADAEYELGRDAVKMDGSAPVRLYTLDAQTLYAINEQPTSNKAISLGYKVAADGEYTLSASRMDKEVEIYDNELQQVVDLKQGDYTFTTQAGVNNTRFTISVKANMPTSINSNIATDEHVTIYTITGIMLYDNVMLNDIQLQSGIYIIKSATKIEKVVVK